MDNPSVNSVVCRDCTIYFGDNLLIVLGSLVPSSVLLITTGNVYSHGSVDHACQNTSRGLTSGL